MSKNPFKVYKEMKAAYQSRPEVSAQLQAMAEELEKRSNQISSLVQELGKLKTAQNKAQNATDLAVKKATDALLVEHAKYKESVLEKELILTNQLDSAKNLSRHLKQELDESDGQVFHLQKAVSSVKEQADVSIDALQKELLRERQEKKDLVFRAERLQKLLDDMQLYLVDPKDVEGRIFSKIAPLIDEEGYELLKAGSGRLKAKIIEPGRQSRIIYLEKAD